MRSNGISIASGTRLRLMRLHIDKPTTKRANNSSATAS